jgi:hypothetical protein
MAEDATVGHGHARDIGGDWLVRVAVSLQYSLGDGLLGMERWAEQECGTGVDVLERLRGESFIIG